MMQKQRAAITAVGHYVPEKVLSNKDLETMVDTTDEWIRTRTGIRERHILEQGGTSDLAVPAIRMALNNRGIAPDEIDVIITATVTPDMFFPPTSAVIQEKIGAKNAWGFDLSAACSGFLYALVVGTQFIETGAYKKVLVVGADKMSSIVDYKDRNNCILFGDAGAAVLLEASDDPALGIIDYKLYGDGSGGRYLYMKGGGSLNPATHETVDQGMHYLYQDGKAVFNESNGYLAQVRPARPLARPARWPSSNLPKGWVCVAKKSCLRPTIPRSKIFRKLLSWAPSSTSTTFRTSRFSNNVPEFPS